MFDIKRQISPKCTVLSLCMYNCQVTGLKQYLLQIIMVMSEPVIQGFEKNTGQPRYRSIVKVTSVTTIV